MSLLRSLGLFVCRLYGDDVSNLSPIEKWSLKASKLCSADEIITAAIVKSIAMNYDDWKYSSKPLGITNYRDIRTLTHTIRKVTVVVTWIEDLRGPSYSEFKVNDILINLTMGNQIRQVYFDIKDKRRRIKLEADKALAEQKRIDEAWNLAESLLGMKRNEFGALVPIKTIAPEPKCDCDYDQLCKICGSIEEEA